MVISDRTRMLASTIKKLYHRDAHTNIRRILAKSHDADIAAVLQLLNTDEAFEIFTIEVKPESRASIISYLEPDLQKIFLDRLSSAEATALIENMEPDDAADLLSQLPDEDSKSIIEGLMEESSTEVVDLMGYPEDSAGGIMSSDYLALTEGTSVEQVIQALQGEEAENKVAFYIYVVNRTGHLVGVVSLKQILLSRKTTELRDLMTTNVISVSTETDQEQVASLVAQYDFLSLPVVDKANVLVGVITVDDVIDVIRQEAEEDLLSMGQAGWGLDMTWYEHLFARLPWLILSLLIGLLCFYFIQLWGANASGDSALQKVWGFAGMLPIILSLGVMAGNQSSTVTLSALQSGRLFGDKFLPHIRREGLISFMAAIVFGIILYFIVGIAETDLLHEDFLTLAVPVQIILAGFFGTFIPIICYKLKADALKVAPPIYAAMADMSSVLILLFFYNAV